MSECFEKTRRHFLTLSSAAVSSLILLADPLFAQPKQPKQGSPLNKFSNGTDLGNLILSLSPYAFQPDPGGSSDRIWIDSDNVEYQEKPGNWYFKGATHNIARSVRIPYRFYWANQQANPGTPPVVEIKDYFLIGFEGGGAY